jgi:hypothetical protein
VLDNYVYLLVAAGPQRFLDPLLDEWMATYDLLLHVPIVAAPAADGVRATDPSFQRAVDVRLREELDRRGLPVRYLVAEDRRCWLDSAERFVDELLAPPQLQLL